MATAVSIVGTHYGSELVKDQVSKALDLIDFKFNPSVKSIAIKPNLCYYWNAATGYTTDPKVVAVVIDIVRERYGDNVNIKIVEADASAMRTKYAFPILGYENLAKEKAIELFDLSNDVLVDKTVSVGKRKISFKVPQLLLESDLFINVPKLKIMRITKITCAMKNVFGCIGYPRKFVYHPFLDEAIVGINKILKPHLTVVDGLVALGRHPVRLGLIMAGVDPFSVDWVASQIMGYNPTKVRSLEIAVKEKLGVADEIIIKGDSILDFRNRFPKANFASSNHWWRILFWLLSAYHRVVGDIIPPVIEEA